MQSVGAVWLMTSLREVFWGSLCANFGREPRGSASIPSFEIGSGDSHTGLAHCLSRLTAHCGHHHKPVVGPNSAERKSVHCVALYMKLIQHCWYSPETI